MATMGLWTLEGDILYGLLLGHTWYLRSRVPAASSFRSSLGSVVQYAGR